MRETCSESQSSHSVLPLSGSGGPQGSVEEAASVCASCSNPGFETASGDRSVKVRVRTAALIPAYRPTKALLDIVLALNPPDWEAVVIVDDGSGPDYQPVFTELAHIPGVQVIAHAVNLGKGAALKSGMNFILCTCPEIAGVVTADADGQHDPGDISSVRQIFEREPEAVVLGVRDFRGRVPLRSRLGNLITRGVLRTVLGQNLADSQTGLRAVPTDLIPSLLRVRASGYEFELEMLIAVKHRGIRVIERPIRTIYTPGNPSSHFRPLRDSMRIYFVLLRFAYIGLLTAVLDNLIFYLLLHATGNILGSQLGARMSAVVFNYAAVRRAVFLSEERHAILLPRYLSIVIMNAGLSYAGIRLLTSILAMSVFEAKLVVEALLFAVNFAILRDVVFTKRNKAPGNAPLATNWDGYYKRVPFTAHLTRRYTGFVLRRLLSRYCQLGRPQTILEIGGGNSCFLDGIIEEFRPAAYHILDLNEYGITLLRNRFPDRTILHLHRGDVLRSPKFDVLFDVVFSVGLIEHFKPAETRQAIRTHFELLREGGYTILSFPTPTWLYKLARAICEAAEIWQFPDERPLHGEEVLSAVKEYGEVVFAKTLWPVVFTQHVVVIRKS